MNKAAQAFDGVLQIILAGHRDIDVGFDKIQRTKCHSKRNQEVARSNVLSRSGMPQRGFVKKRLSWHQVGRKMCRHRRGGLHRASPCILQLQFEETSCPQFVLGDGESDLV